MKKISISVEQINNILPQTQCTLCTYNGCKPYATAIVENNENIDLCLPGGVKTLKKLADLTGKDATPFMTEMQEKQKPILRAAIQEDICIGCTICIQACPVDAIVGAAKQMHTVITDECTGCELCVEPCPVDCIDIIDLGPGEITYKQAQHYRERYEFREHRLANEKNEERKKLQAAKKISEENKTLSIEDKKRFIAEAMARVKNKK